MDPTQRDYTDLPQVVHSPKDDGLQAVQPEKIVRFPSEHEGPQAIQPEKIVWHSGQDVFPISHEHEEESKEQQPQKTRRRRMCGLAPRTFWILVAVAAIVMVGAVAGGVGGSLAQKDTSRSLYTQYTSAPLSSTITGSSAIASTTNLTTTSASSTTSTPSITTTQVPGPTSTILRDCPSSNNTLYSYGATDDPMEFRKICGLSYLNSQQASSGAVNQLSTSLDDCINICAAYNVQNRTEIADGSSFVCNAVCWRNGFVDDDFPGQCFGYATQNSSGEFVVAQQAKCDSAAWINQSF